MTLHASYLVGQTLFIAGLLFFFKCAVDRAKLLRQAGFDGRWWYTFARGKQRRELVSSAAWKRTNIWAIAGLIVAAPGVVLAMVNLWRMVVLNEPLNGGN